MRQINRTRFKENGFGESLATPFLAMPTHGRLFAGLTVGTFVLALAVSHSRCGPGWGAGAGSLWCLLGAFGPVVAIIANRAHVRSR